MATNAAPLPDTLPDPATSKARAIALREQILALVGEYHAVAFERGPFVPGETPVPVSGKVFDADDVRYLVDSGLDFWLTAGRFAREFESRFAKVFGTRKATLVNSGSSANLVALSALTSPTLGDRQLRPGDEVITVASGFPTTVNPIFQNGLVPVFIDVTIPTLGPRLDMLEAALSSRTRAVMIAHTLGNPFNLAAVTAFARKHDLWFIEDCCDAVGATYDGKPVGTFGDIATASFYPAHHITMGEGGAVMTNKPALHTLIESFRDWGRDCWCEPGKDNTCGKRFDWQLGQLPHGYDHKYTYSHVGYNLKATDMQAAVGVSQLAKLPGFIAARRRNFDFLHAGLADLQDVLILPEAEPNSEPSWFGFPMFVRQGAGFTRNEIVAHLEQHGIATRLVFAGNLVRQPAYQGHTFRVVGELTAADQVMNDAFWVGVYPGLTEAMLSYVVETIRRFCRA
jgi:CDP-4-dehydro-6-deoxyglucose reductase, E1